MKHWQIMLVLFLLIVPANVLVDGLLMIFGIPTWTPELQFISLHVTTPGILIYPLVTGRKLRSLSSVYGLKRLPNELVVLGLTIWMTAYSTSIFIAEYNSTLHISMIVVNFAAWLLLSSYPAQQLKSIELRRDAGFWEYVSETFQFMLWPLAVFSLQPRINRLAEQAEIATKRTS